MNLEYNDPVVLFIALISVSFSLSLVFIVRSILHAIVYLYAPRTYRKWRQRGWEGLSLAFSVTIVTAIANYFLITAIAQSMGILR